MKPQKTRDVLKLVKAQGWVFLRSGQGSHEIWGLPDESVKASIPAGHREVTAGVLRQLQAAGLELPKEWK